MLTQQLFPNEEGEEKPTLTQSTAPLRAMLSVSITNYQQVFVPCFTKTGGPRIAIRRYDYNDELYLVTVNPYTFTTECAPVTDCFHRSQTGDTDNFYTKQKIESTPYRIALKKFTSPPYKLQNYGLTQSNNTMNGAFLTVDMCPSIKPFEADFFEALTSYTEEPTPVAICITGLWLLHHPKEFNWLIEQEKNNRFKITWVNHSFSHVYYPDLTSEADLSKNFLLSDPASQEEELMAVERLLIKNNQPPSVFFRAPGLVTDETLIQKLNRLGLIPVGSNAWLAKEEEPADGSIILVHGNSNEPPGIKKAMSLLKQKRFQFFSLSEAAKPSLTENKDDLPPPPLEDKDGPPSSKRQKI